MGVYDTYGEKLNAQIKLGECLCNFFKVGDSVDLADGIYVSYEGAIVIFGGKFVAELTHEQIVDKWGGALNLQEEINNRNPVKQIVDEISAQYEDKKGD